MPSVAAPPGSAGSATTPSLSEEAGYHSARPGPPRRPEQLKAHLARGHHARQDGDRARLGPVEGGQGAPGRRPALLPGHARPGIRYDAPPAAVARSVLSGHGPPRPGARPAAGRARRCPGGSGGGAASPAGGSTTPPPATPTASRWPRACPSRRRTARGSTTRPREVSFASAVAPRLAPATRLTSVGRTLARPCHRRPRRPPGRRGGARRLPRRRPHRRALPRTGGRRARDGRSPGRALRAAPPVGGPGARPGLARPAPEPGTGQPEEGAGRAGGPRATRLVSRSIVATSAAVCSTSATGSGSTTACTTREHQPHREGYPSTTESGVRIP